MIKDNQKHFNRLQVVIDGVMLIVVYILSYYLRFFILPALNLLTLDDGTGYYPLPEYAQYIVYLVPAYLILYNWFNLYSSRRNTRYSSLLWILIKANSLGLLFLYFILGFIKKELDISRAFVVIFVFLNLTSCFVFRILLNRLLRVLRKKGFNIRHVLIVGYSHAAEAYIDRIRDNPQWGYYIHGILDNVMVKGTRYKGISVIGTLNELDRILEQNNFDEIAIAINISDYRILGDIVKSCERTGAHTKFIPDYRGVIPTLPYIEDLSGLSVINIRNVPLTNNMNRFIKRTVDIVGSIVALIIFAIPMIVIAIIIKATSPGPVIFKQTRVGFQNKEFNMLKFRSMTEQPVEKERQAWTTKNDVRVTKIGRFIRRTSLDELPQFFNVLLGNMSLVGPRPERPYFVEKFKDEIPRYMIKHQVRPGITGWAQIKGYRGDTSIIKRIECDLYYIENWTLSFDIKILILTLFRGFINKNAY